MRRLRPMALAVALASMALAGAIPPAVAARDAVQAPRFIDETASSGLQHVYRYGSTDEVPEGGYEFAVGGGLAVFDCDDDGRPDLYLAGGSGRASLYRNESEPGGQLRFTRITDDATDLAQVSGAYPIDIDGDDVDDLVALRRGENVLLRGLGSCRFERANESLGLDPGADWTTAFSATWEVGADLPTLAFGNYQAVDESGGLTAGCSDNRLFRPEPGATSYGPALALSPGWCTLSMLFSDWDRSGRRDLRISNDREFYIRDGQEQLWRMGDSEPPALYSEEDGWQRVNIWGMGIASQDLGDDGYPETYLTSMFGNRLETLADGPTQPLFRNIAGERGVDSGRPVAGDDERPSTSWHPEFKDVNNDGRVDLFVSKGNLDAMPDRANADPSSLLLGAPNGRFVERTQEAGLVDFARGRGAAVVDLNLDGLLDIVEVNLGEPAEAWRNVGTGTSTRPEPMGHWLAVDLEQKGGNHDAVGAWIEVRSRGQTQRREVTIGGGHGSGQLVPHHFGLGAAKRAQVRVQWPDGVWGPWQRVAADGLVRIGRDTEPLAFDPAAEIARSPRSVVTPVAPTDEASDVPPVTSIDPASCVRSTDPSKSVARLWDEALLDAIRRDFPAPTVHARNLYHASAAMWDAWAAYDPVADGVFVRDKITRDDPSAARDEAISFAAYRVLRHRYENAEGGAESLHEFDQLMADLCYPIKRATTKGDSAAALGNRVAARIIETTLTDGSREARGYEYPKKGYRPVNEPMIVARPGTVMTDPNRWQPLALETSITQNGQLLAVGPQHFVGQHWGQVTSFALPPSDAGVPIDPGPPPLLHDPATDATFKAQAEEVIAFSSLLDPRDGVVIDISPASLGGNTLGTNDGTGHALNPVTGEPYAPELALRADLGRAVAEFWADGPDSETPPGHWNTLANAVTDEPGFERRIGGVGEELDPLEWDVKMYLALNGAVHDAAVAAWGAKGHYDFTRPIAMVRYMGGLGQSSDPSLPSYHPDGLPLIDGSVELITEASASAGERHAHLAGHVGGIAIRAWAGGPADPVNDVGGVDWIRAVEWVPYQKASFVTPAFAGYVSGHSTFSRAAAEVLAAMTGSEYFPGGLSTWTIPAGSLKFERGPERDVVLQWATYFDAADQAGLSRLYGGIHISADDLRGRVMGAACGRDAWALAQRYWDGSARD